MTRNEAKRNAILGVFCPKRNVTFFFVSLLELGTDRNGAERSGTPILGRDVGSVTPTDGSGSNITGILTDSRLVVVLVLELSCFSQRNPARRHPQIREFTL